MNSCDERIMLDELWSSDEAYLIGAAYIGKPTQEKALVYAFAGKEYLVPVRHKWDGTKVIESLIRLDLAERVVSRPNGTSCITKMNRSKEISDQAKAALIKGVKAWFLLEKGYMFQIIPFK
ncbi:MAG: hypothetical protein AB7S81_02230 [Bdellovibrionales bacterium]